MRRVSGAVIGGALRPVPWLVTLGSVALWAVLLRFLGPPTGVRTMFLLVQGTGWLGSLGAAFLTSRDVDPPRPIIAVTPAPRRIWTVRWLGWLIGGLVVFASLGASLGGTSSVTGLLVTWTAFSCFALGSAVVALAADLTGGVLGVVGSVALVIVAFIALPPGHRPVVEIEYAHSVSHWVWQAVVTVVLLGLFVMRARR